MFDASILKIKYKQSYIMRLLGSKEFPGSFKDQNEPNKLKISCISIKKRQHTIVNQ